MSGIADLGSILSKYVSQRGGRLPECVIFRVSYMLVARSIEDRLDKLYAAAAAARSDAHRESSTDSDVGFRGASDNPAVDAASLRKLVGTLSVEDSDDTLLNEREKKKKKRKRKYVVVCTHSRYDYIFALEHLAPTSSPAPPRAPCASSGRMPRRAHTAMPSYCVPNRHAKARPPHSLPSELRVRATSRSLSKQASASQPTLTWDDTVDDNPSLTLRFQTPLSHFAPVHQPTSSHACYFALDLLLALSVRLLAPSGSPGPDG
ncbi:hypothetical protein DFH11DRAFT_1825677 [Phellopilus nigrolimitatus]|nr:hypothetical protein DFH11DRAFT_1825677 [Phellopilus nigrolimitatus]